MFIDMSIDIFVNIPTDMFIDISFDMFIDFDINILTDKQGGRTEKAWTFGGGKIHTQKKLSTITQ